MAGGFTVNVKGLDAVLSRLDTMKSNIAKEVDAVIDANAEEIAGNARQDVPHDIGQLANSISVDRSVGFLKRNIVVQKFYAAYVEFGTGEYAAEYVAGLPAELQTYAMTFFVNGKGRMRAAPFLYPNLIRQKPIIIQDLKDVLKSK